MGYSQATLAERLAVKRSTIGRWERAATAPLPRLRPELTRALEITFDELNDLLNDIEDVTEQHDKSHKFGRTVRPNPADDAAMQRAALQIANAVSTRTPIPPRALETIFSGINEALGNPLDLDEWDAVVREYAHMIVTRPAGALIHDLSADLVAVGDLLERHFGTPEEPGLFRVGAGLSCLLAIDLADSGDERAARRAWIAAEHAADASGDQALRAWVRRREALPDRSRAALEMPADDAIKAANGTP